MFTLVWSLVYKFSASANGPSTAQGIEYSEHDRFCANNAPVKHRKGDVAQAGDSRVGRRKSVSEIRAGPTIWQHICTLPSNCWQSNCACWRQRRLSTTLDVSEWMGQMNA